MPLNLKLFVAFTIGLVIGVAFMVLVIARGPNKVIQSMWVNSITEHTVQATMIQEGKALEVQRLIEASFPQSASGMKALDFPPAVQNAVLWRIRSYYERAGKPIPPELAPTL